MSDPTSTTELHAQIAALDERLQRVESIQAIERLAHQYAFAADARDLENLLPMFIDDVNCGQFGTGREALRASYEIVHRGFYRTVHQVVGQQIEFSDADHATGQVMMRAEHEVGDRWIVGMICMFDTYEQRDGQWYFVRRKPESWYSTDYGQTPAGPTFTATDWPSRPPRLPQLHETWGAFWDRDETRRDELTDHP